MLVCFRVLFRGCGLLQCEIDGIPKLSMETQAAMSTLGFRHDLVPMGSGHHEAGVGCCARGSASSAGMVWWISAQNQMGMRCIGKFEICTCAWSIRCNTA